MANTGERMLDLLALLQQRRRWSGSDLADRLAVSIRTLRRDVDRLRNLGYPIHADRGVDGGYQMGSGAKLPPLLLDDDEAVAIAVGLRTAAAQPISGMADSSMSAMVKIGQVLPGPLQRRVEALSGAMGSVPAPISDPVPIGTLTVLAGASRDSEGVRFAYIAADGEASDRHLEPHHVVPLNGHWYLIGWDLDRHDWRTFRLDRISAPRLTKRPFHQRELPAPDPVTHLRRTIATLRSVHQVDLVVEVDVGTVEPHLGSWGSATAEGPDATRIRMRIPDFGWAVLMLAILDAEVRDVDPPELREFLGVLAERFSALARAPAPGQPDPV